MRQVDSEASVALTVFSAAHSCERAPEANVVGCERDRHDDGEARRSGSRNLSSIFRGADQKNHAGMALAVEENVVSVRSRAAARKSRAAASGTRAGLAVGHEGWAPTRDIRGEMHVTTNAPEFS